MDLPSRKRSHSTHLGDGFAAFSDNKSRRTTPSPFAGATPEESSGYGNLAFGDGYFDLTTFVYTSHSNPLSLRSLLTLLMMFKGTNTNYLLI